MALCLLYTRAMDIRADIAQRIVERVSSSLERDVSVLDTQGRVLASTNSSLIHSHLPLQDQDSTERTGSGPTAHEQRVPIPLTYAEQFVGTLVLEDMLLHDHQTTGIAKTLAELIIHQMLVIEELPRQARLRDKFIADLLRGRLQESDLVAQQEAALLGIDLDLPRVIAVIDVEALHTSVLKQSIVSTSLPKVMHTLRIEQMHLDLVDRARRTIANHLEDVYAFIGERWFVLVAVADQPFETAHHRIALRARTFLRALSDELFVYSAGVGRHYPAWEGLSRSFTDACFAMETGTRLHGPGGAYCREDLGLADFIWHPERSAKVDNARQLLAAIGDDLELVTTLQTFFVANLSPSVAAEQLHIHRHTLTYRLNKIQRRTGLDPCKFMDAAQLHAALLLRTIEDSGS